MPALRRLKTRQEFLAVAATRRKWAMPGLVLQARRRPDAEPPRIGFTVSRKVGNAVARNRARRRLRAAVAEILPRLGQPGSDYVVIGRKATLERPYGDLLLDLTTALKRIEAKSPAGKSQAAGSQAAGSQARGPRAGPSDGRRP